MDPNVKRTIESFAWDCTIGAGNVSEDDDHEPNQDALQALARHLSRPLEGEDIGAFCSAWSRHMQEAAQP